MKKQLKNLAVVMAIALLLSLPGLAATTWKVDPQQSAAQFSVRYMAISTVWGAFSKLMGTVLVDDQDITKSTVDVSIDVTTVDTREPARDKDLRSDHFFDVEHFTTMTSNLRR